SLDQHRLANGVGDGDEDGPFVGSKFEVEGDNNFFFSSRRRHTSSTRDWSSDVCSSDLCLFLTRTPPLTRRRASQADWTGCRKDRSEERRVGKEGRCRRTAAERKKKRG